MVASESVFSTAGRIIDPHRSRLHHITIEALMCTQSWLKDSKKQDEASESSNYVTVLEDADVEVEGTLSSCQTR